MDLNTPMKGQVPLMGSCEYSYKQRIENNLLHHNPFWGKGGGVHVTVHRDKFL